MWYFFTALVLHHGATKMAPPPPSQRRGLSALCSFRRIFGGIVALAAAAQLIALDAFHRLPDRTKNDNQRSDVAVASHGTDLVPILEHERLPRDANAAVIVHDKELKESKSPAAIAIRPDASSTGDALTNGTLDRLPEWIQRYVRWHARMREEFPGSALYLDPQAPQLLIRTCLGICGGLNDRLGQLPWDVYLANQTNRLLLIHWHRPVPIDHFLQPNIVNWTVDSNVPGFGPPLRNARTYSRDEMRTARSYTDLFEGYASDRPDADFWDTHLDEALQRAITGEFRNHKVLRFNLLGHIAEDQLETRLQTLGETDLLHWSPSFGILFRAFFRPSPGVQNDLNDLYRTLGMSPGTYSAVHCRVRHPKAHPPHMVVLGKNANYNADKSGLPWTGETKSFAIATATQAITCAETLLETKEEPMYLLSDSADLVRYMSVELPNASSTSHTEARNDPVTAQALEVVKRARVVSTVGQTDVAHIDKNKGRAPREYSSTFVDFYVAAQARCVTFGVGFYALFAAKVSGTSCRLLYQQEAWGTAVDKTSRSPVCNLLPEPISNV
jgi:hypothetical protein